VRTSISEYIPGLLKYWWIVVIGFAGGGLGFGIDAAQGDLVVPYWVWIAVACGGLVAAQFLAFHRVRVERDELKAAGDQAKPTDKLLVLECLRSTAFESGPETSSAFGKDTKYGLTLWIGITAAPRARIESIELEIKGRLLPSDWNRRDFVSQHSQYVNVGLPGWVNKGEHTVRLVAWADGKKYPSEDFNIEVPDPPIS